ncbi:hypothetical protein ACFFU9_15915 [Mariniflexile ostreae]|uniref:Uncharacterized protein n=1 Tax=Mariniflexile ostreae TaxID=1520892 RepID=A0ABV5FFK3_9FLAO
MKPEFVDSRYQMVWHEHLNSIDAYGQLLNWANGEFILYQTQMGNKGLTVFFPNGWFFINLIEEKNIAFEIIVKSKCKKTMIKFYKHLQSLVEHFKRYSVLFLKENGEKGNSSC